MKHEEETSKKRLRELTIKEKPKKPFYNSTFQIETAVRQRNKQSNNKKDRNHKIKHNF